MENLQGNDKMISKRVLKNKKRRKKELFNNQ